MAINTDLKCDGCRKECSEPDQAVLFVTPRPSDKTEMVCTMMLCKTCFGSEPEDGESFRTAIMNQRGACVTVATYREVTDDEDFMSTSPLSFWDAY